jgi:hypothetical protein
MESGTRMHSERISPSDDPRGFNLLKLFWQGKIGPAFWTITGLISLTANVILIVILLLVGKRLLAAKDLINEHLIGGLYYNFILMDRARIQTTVEVSDTIPVKFDLPVKTRTTVVLTEDTQISGTRVNLATGGLTISNAPADILLPAGTELPIALDITVPVDTSVPVNLTVPVDIPLNQTDLHTPFIGLQQVISPYYWQLASSPSTWQETQLCGSGLDWFCQWLTEAQ